LEYQRVNLEDGGDLSRSEIDDHTNGENLERSMSLNPGHRNCRVLELDSSAPTINFSLSSNSSDSVTVVPFSLGVMLRVLKFQQMSTVSARSLRYPPLQIRNLCRTADKIS
jgi:hypothetical protein